MNIALIALATDQTPLRPPLTLAYIAAALEQQRHIVRMYDLALAPEAGNAQPSKLLRAFRPQLVVLASEREDLIAAALNTLDLEQTSVFLLAISRDSDSPTQACDDLFTWMAGAGLGQSKRLNLGRQQEADGATQCLDDLAFPARYLLPLESYGLRACGGELQTTLMIGQPTSEHQETYNLRSPAQIITELRSVAREHGIRHYRLCGAPLTADIGWLNNMAQSLIQAKLGVGWEGVVYPQLLNSELLAQMRLAGCEALRFDFNVTEVLESAASRAGLKEIIAQARQQGIYARAELVLEQPYKSAPQLVDVAATFGLDDVVFEAASAWQMQRHEAAHIEEMARQRYSTQRSRQRFINRFGPRLGQFVWSMRRSILLTRLLGDDSAGKADEHEDVVSPA